MFRFSGAVRVELISVWFYIGCGLCWEDTNQRNQSMTLQMVQAEVSTRAERVPPVCVQAEETIARLALET